MKNILMLIFIVLMFFCTACLRQQKVKYTIKTYYKCTEEVALKKDSLNQKQLKTAFNLCLSKYENLNQHKFE